MKTFLFLFAVLCFLVPARSAFFDEKCYHLKGRCKKSCQKNEEFVALCGKSLKCCLILQLCGQSKEKWLRFKTQTSQSDMHAPASCSFYSRLFITKTLQ
ncbi:PREDICTED: beta-defensin 106-like [Ceratotherium simum simum]|uniref:Beta-defensin n=1 Tax=Ceratotherium simum simum TaxID=73337 RepID=A0ABM0I5B3_CERSS|nr:PREDICTED: beta-defensin 106-like [Ceratotherium simum simum]